MFDLHVTSLQGLVTNGHSLRLSNPQALPHDYASDSEGSWLRPVHSPCTPGFACQRTLIAAHSSPGHRQPLPSRSYFRKAASDTAASAQRKARARACIICEEVYTVVKLFGTPNSSSSSTMPGMRKGHCQLIHWGVKVTHLHLGRSAVRNG